MSDSPERIISGFRPTSDLTVGNYLGAIKPALELQDDPDKDLYVFVADLHGLTDNDPRDIAPYRDEVIQDSLALGIDPEKTTLYFQSDTAAEVVQIAGRLGRYVSTAELMRLPTLKEKMVNMKRAGKSETDDEMTANYALLGYPVLMAADILAQSATKVAVGEDQEAHLEMARKIAGRFNKTFDTSVLVEPRISAMTPLRIVGLDGKAKMSKTNPSKAIILTDDPNIIRNKIRKATLAPVGEWDDTIESHFMVAGNTTTDPDRLGQLAELKAAHMAGTPVSKEFKDLWSDITEDLVVDFQAKKAALSKEDIEQAIRIGGERATLNAQGVLRGMRDAMGF